MFSKLEGHFPFCVTQKVPEEGLEKGDDPTIDLYRGAEPVFNGEYFYEKTSGYRRQRRVFVGG